MRKTKRKLQFYNLNFNINRKENDKPLNAVVMGRLRIVRRRERKRKTKDKERERKKKRIKRERAPNDGVQTSMNEKKKIGEKL